MTAFPMFPLGSVLFPHMPLALRVFEERYLAMLAHILESEPSEFGVVLIERGQEVGGGEQRFGVGTVAQITQLEAPESFIALVAEGERRFEVVEWLDEAPYPRASIRPLPGLVWDDALQPLRDEAEVTVRRTLAKASEYTDQLWAANVELADDPVAGAWQLAAIAPVGSLDQMTLLRSTSMEQLLSQVRDLTEVAAETLATTWPDDELGLDLDDED